jgi:hypothetical protein
VVVSQVAAPTTTLSSPYGVPASYWSRGDRRRRRQLCCGARGPRRTESAGLLALSSVRGLRVTGVQV